MINEESVRVVDAARLNEFFYKPLYESYSFAQIPPTILRLLAGTDGGLPPKILAHLPTSYRKVVLVLLDSFGWRFLSRHADRYPFLRRFVDQGVISKLTTQFPSTTAAHITTINTGQTVGETGVYEWFYYEPSIDAVISPLIYSFAGDKLPGTLRPTVAPAAILPRHTIYQALARHGVKSYVLNSALYANSHYNQVMNAGAKTVGFRSLSEALVTLGNLLHEEKERTYIYFYFDMVDAICHYYGPDSAYHEAEIDTFFTAMERLLMPRLGTSTDTLLLITADHGQIQVSPERTFYLNHHLPELRPMLKTTQQGVPLVPAGSARDMFLYLKEPHLQGAYDLLRQALNGRAEVYFTSDLAEQGFFGSTLSPLFKARLGNLVILPYEHETVWWYEDGKYEMPFQGHHGGLTASELHTFLGVLAL